MTVKKSLRLISPTSLNQTEDREAAGSREATCWSIPRVVAEADVIAAMVVTKEEPMATEEVAVKVLTEDVAAATVMAHEKKDVDSKETATAKRPSVTVIIVRSVAAKASVTVKAGAEEATRIPQDSVMKPERGSKRRTESKADASSRKLLKM